jgi:CHAD domain-containing protein
MAYRFELDESLGVGFQRIAREQIDRAAAELAEGKDRVTAVHAARKALKRIRALLRLVRPALGEERYRRENERFRGIGELLAGQRDRDVMLETLTGLAAVSRGGLQRQVLSLRKVLAEQAVAAGGSSPSVADALSRLEDGKTALHAIEIDGAGLGALWLGLENSYRRARRAMAAAYDEPSDEAFHEWRKTVQRHWRHMAVLVNAWPEVMRARVEAARELSQILGDDHDLAVLAARVESLPDTRSHAGVVRAARAAQRSLRDKARPLGERLLAAKPGELRRRIELYWTTAAVMAADAEKAKPAPKAKVPSKRRIKMAVKRGPMGRSA